MDRLGEIPLSRILARPAPGTATEADLIQVNDSKRRLCELVDGVLVEKAMGLRESLLAGASSWRCSRAFVVPRNLGLVAGADGAVRLFPGLVRIPDVAFISWQPDPRRTDTQSSHARSSHPTWPSRFSVKVIPRPRCGGSGGITSRRELTLSGRSIPKSELWRSTSEVKINRGSMIARRRSRDSTL